MLRPQDDIYVTLPSNVSGVPGNKPSKYKTGLPTPLQINGAWEVALLETHYPHQITNFNATTLVVVRTENSGKPQSVQPQSYWMLPQSPQAQRRQTQNDQVDGYWPSGEEDEELDPGVTRYRAHDGAAPIAPQTAAQSQTSTEGSKKPDQAKGDDNKPEPAKEGEAGKKEGDENKPEDAAKKAAEEAAALKKKADNEAKATKEAEEKRQEDLSNHLTKPLFMLAQAGAKFMRDRQNLGKVGQVIHLKQL